MYIDDGVYTDTIGAFGGDNFSPWSTDQGKDGLSSSQRTKILGYHPHAVIVDGGGTQFPLSIYRGQHIEVGNIVFLHGKLTGVGAYSPVDVEQSDDIYLHQLGAAYPDPACDNCEAISTSASSNVTVEECWVWGFGARYGISFYGGLKNTARRNVCRYDGSIDGEPKASVALYDEDQSVAENNIVVDYDVGQDSADDVHAVFYSTSGPALKPPAFPPGLPTGLKTIGWYGNVAVNTVSAFQGGMFFDSFGSIGGTITVVDNVIGNGGAPFKATDDSHGIYISSDDGPMHHSITVRHNTIYNISGVGVRIDPPPAWSAVAFNDNLISNLVPASAQCFNDASGSAARLTAKNNEVFGCSQLTIPSDASLSTANPKLSYLLRVEAGTPGKGSGTDASDRGATVVKRYVNGALTDTDLWPFPNEDFIKRDMCAGPDGSLLDGVPIKTRGHNATGWCASGKTLTKYVWEQLGAASPY